MENKGNRFTLNMSSLAPLLAVIEGGETNSKDSELAYRGFREDSPVEWLG